MLDEIHIRLTLMDLTLTTLSCLFLLVWPIHYARMQYPRVVMSSATVASLVSIRNRVVTRQRPQLRLRSFQIRPSTHQCSGEMTFQSGARLMPDPIRRHPIIKTRAHLTALPDMCPCSRARLTIFPLAHARIVLRKENFWSFRVNFLNQTLSQN